jgi:hypothetical protein
MRHHNLNTLRESKSSSWQQEPPTALVHTQSDKVCSHTSTGQFSGSSNVIQQEASAPKTQSVTRPHPTDRGRSAASVQQGGSGYNYAASFRQTSATPSGNPARDLSTAMSLAATFGSLSTTSTPHMQSSITSDLDASSGVRPSSSSSLHSSRNRVYLGSRPRSSSSLGIGRGRDAGRAGTNSQKCSLSI